MTITVLFLCTGNSARSIIAEALLGAIGGSAFRAQSAGTHPRGVHPLTVRVLQERGVDPSPFHSKPVEAVLGADFDYVITLCDNAAADCPIFPLPTARIHWSIEDPAAVAGDEDRQMAAFRRVAEEIHAHLTAFVPIARRIPEPT